MERKEMQENKANIIKKIDKLMDTLLTKSRMLKGSIYTVSRKRKNSQGNIVNYEGYQLTYKSENNVTKTVYVKKEYLKNVKKLILNYSNARKILEKIIFLNIQLFKRDQNEKK